MAIAKLAIVNGVGYDPWAPKLLDANPVGGRVVLDVGKLVGFEAAAILTAGTRRPTCSR